MSPLVFPITYGTSEYDLSIALRTAILRVPLGLEFTISQLSSEYNDFHFGAFDFDNCLLGCYVLVDIGSGKIKMRQVAVASMVQNKGIGAMMVRHCESWSRMHGYKQIELNARETAVRFYEKHDYKVIGNKFVEVGIPHFKMYKDVG